MLFTTWFTFLCAACLIAISPGSGAVLSMSHGLSYGFKKASGTILGLQTGLLAVLAVAGAGVGSLLLASEFAFNIVKIVGALYLIYLGWSQWHSQAQAPNLAVAGATPSFTRRFLTGFLTNSTNPKGIIFMVAVLPSFIDSHLPVLPQLLILAATMVTVDVVVMHAYALLAASMQGVMRNASARRIQNRLFGGVLMAVGTGLFFVKRSAHSAP